MILGGIPYYYSFFRPDYSVAQNIDMLFFSKQGKLNGEYRRLFKSIFKNPDYLNSQPINVWRGYAFENVCFNHITQIKKALEARSIKG